MRGMVACGGTAGPARTRTEYCIRKYCTARYGTVLYGTLGMRGMVASPTVPLGLYTPDKVGWASQYRTQNIRSGYGGRSS